MRTRSTIALILLLGTSACTSYVGSSIGVPDVPVPTEARGRLEASVALSGIKDVRDTVPQEGAEVQYTEPRGPVSETVERALQDALTAKGIVVGGGSSKTVWGEVRRWRSQVITTTTSNIKSEASLYIEVQDQAGRSVYSGTYHGSRASQFPIASQRDIEASLGLAMSQAIGQMLEDEEFLAALWR